MAEKFDKFNSLIFLSSMAGGTGSGVGSYAVRCLKDEFSKTNMVSFQVAPKSTGEVILQNYNSIFSLST